MELPDGLLERLVNELDAEDVSGIVLGGSHARGEATVYSDVDIACFVKDEGGLRPKRFSYRDGYLISVGTKTAAGVRRDMARPNTAIWVVPGIADCRVLLDKDGSVSALLEEARAFTWEPLQEAADRYASFNMAGLVEAVHKILSEALKGDRSALAHASSNLLTWLTEAVAVQRGVLVKSDSSYYRQVQESVGLDSTWTRYHRLVAGIDHGVGETSAVPRHVAALRLYKETATLLRPVMAAEHLEIVEQAIRLAEEAVPGLNT